MSRRERLEGGKPAARLWVMIAVAVVLVAGVFFRFTNLDNKIYWMDEVYTSFMLSGHPMEEIKALTTSREIPVRELERFQRLRPGSSVLDTALSLARYDTHHPPLYYVSARLWAGTFGDTPGQLRILSALFSLLVFPCLFWLCRELFDDERAAWVALCLVAVSPFHLSYAQEAREYSLWTATTLFASAALLFAQRGAKEEDRRRWWIYAAGVAAGMYTHTLFGLVIAAHGVYILGNNMRAADLKARRIPRTVRNFLLACAAGLLLFAPWAFAMLRKLDSILASNSWSGRELAATQLLVNWVGNVGRVFMDFDLPPFRHVQGVGDQPVKIITTMFVGGIAAYSLVSLYRRTERRTWLFVLMLIGVTHFILAMPDIFRGGMRSAVERYQVTAFLGVQLSVAYLFAEKTRSREILRRHTWLVVLVVIIVAGAWSCVRFLQAETWRNKGGNSAYIAAAHDINKGDRPLVIVHPHERALLYVMIPALEDSVHAHVLDKAIVPIVPRTYSDVFLIGSHSTQFLKSLEEKNNARLRLVCSEDATVWRLER